VFDFGPFGRLAIDCDLFGPNWCTGIENTLNRLLESDFDWYVAYHKRLVSCMLLHYQKVTMAITVNFLIGADGFNQPSYATPSFFPGRPWDNRHQVTEPAKFE